MSRSSQPDSAYLPDLAARELGGSVVAATDELFAGRENLIKAEQSLQAVQEKSGVIVLDKQAEALIVNAALLRDRKSVV